MNMLIEKNLMVPMRDGVRLATDVYRPAGGGPVPVLLARLPYNKDLPLTTRSAIDALRAVQAGYAVVLQDCRGRFASEGEFTPIVHEVNDGADTVAWIGQQRWSTGQVGTVGGSYLGFTQWLLAREQPEALRAMAPLVTTSDYYRAPWRHTGVFELGFSLFWSLGMASEELRRQIRQGRAGREQMGALLQVMSRASPPFEHLPLVDMPLLREFAPYYCEWLAHPNYDDYWRSMAHNTYYEQITVPALHIGGWCDVFLGPTLENYTGMKQRGGSAVARQHQRLLIGPWSHGSWTGVFPERSYGLAASGDVVDLVGVQLRWFHHWLKGVENGVEQDKPVKLFVMGLDQWREEDDWPLPDTHYRRYYLHSGGHANSAAGDGTLSPAAPGTEEAEDAYLYDPRRPVPTVGGAILLSLLAPGQICELHLDLWATSNLFKRGHRIRLEVSSSNFPRFDRNTNTGGTIETETERDFVQAVNRVYHDAAHPSHLILPIIEGD